MKKIFALIAVFAALCMFGGCDVSSDGKGTGGQQNEPSKKDLYAPLNEMLAADYSKIGLTVTDTFDGAYLKSEYNFLYADDGSVTLQYAVERFAELSLPGASEGETPETSSDGMKVIYRGEAKIEDGKAVFSDGRQFSLPANIAQIGFTFKEEYFGNADLAGIYLKADVTDAEAFWGSEISCSDMKISATFLDFFYDITITYTAEDGSGVEYLYTFTV